MTREVRSAGGVVVSRNTVRPQVLLVDQIRSNGERQTVAPKGRLEPGESPLTAAAREVSEEAGIENPLYVCYLGQQRYSYTDSDGAAGTKAVDWFLFAADKRAVSPLAAEGFVRARWLPLDQAIEAVTHGSFAAYLRSAQDVIEWRQATPLPHSQVLNQAVWRLSNRLSTIIEATPGAGLGLCGSAARGDFVEGWSDIDIIGWGIDLESRAATQVTRTAERIAGDLDVQISVRFADSHGKDATGTGGLYDQKLRAVLARHQADLPVIAGTGPPPAANPPNASELAAIIGPLHDFATNHLHKRASLRAQRIDRARRVLSVASSAGRNTATVLDPAVSLRLAAVSALLHSRWRNSQLAALLQDYSHFRQRGATDIDVAERLATRAPGALAELHATVT